MIEEYKKTIFLDIDGCILMHQGNLSAQILCFPILLPKTLEKLNEWESNGHKIILTTGRKESMRKITEDQLLKLGVVYDQLVMGLNRGERILINDKKINGNGRVATAIEIKRNQGIGDITIL